MGGNIVNIEDIDEETLRYTIEKTVGASFIADDVANRKYYVVDLSKNSKKYNVGDYIELYADLQQDTPEGTLINEDTVYLTGVN